MSGVGTTQPAGNQVEKETCWYFTSEQLANSPSRRYGIDSDGELSLRQMTAYLIQEMGQRLQVSQLCINTAIVYMHRFYAFHSFTHFHRNTIAAASLFLAAKVEEQPRKLEHVIKAANKCLNQPTSNTTDPHYQEQAQDLVFNENVLLQTLGFDVAIDHPHTHVVKTCHLVKACKDLAQTSYFLASNSLHLTSMCLQYKPTVVACFCIYLACKWSRWEIPQSTEGKHWFHYVDKSVTMDLLKQLTDEFIAIYEKSPSRLKSKLNSIRALAQGAGNRVISKDKKAQEDWKMGDMMKMYHSNIITNDNSNSSTPHSTPYSVTNDPMPAQNPLPTLPPPPPQQLRKSEMHTSQSRSHHSSSNAGSHHHSKLAFAAGDTEPHKGNHKQSHQSGRGRDHTQAAQNHTSMISPSTSSTRSLSNGRSSISGGLLGQPPQRQPTGGTNHQMDIDYHNYHKSRERATANAVATAAHSATVTTHKVPKHDPNRQGKDSMNRVNEPTKPSNKIFPQANMYAGQQMPTVPQSNVNPKVNPMADMQRSLLSNQQRAYTTSNQQQQLMLPANAYPILQPQNSAPRLGNSGTKYDQSKTMSVHMQQQQQQQQTQPQQQPLQKQLLPPLEAQYGGELQQHLQQSHYGNVRATSDMLLGIDEHLGPQFTTSTTAHNAMPEAVSQQLPSKPASIFSPDWDDNKTQNPLLSSYSSSAMNPVSNESFGFKMTSSSSTKDSPKKTEREREPSVRKEKNRLSRSTTDLSIAVPHNQSQQPKVPTLKAPKVEKLEPSATVTANMSELAGTSMGVGAGAKRPNELSNFKQEDDMMRTKVRKMDVLMPGSYADPLKAAQSAEIKLQVGIETNPDLVSSLLKESLCTSNALLQSTTSAQNINPPKVCFEPPTMLAPVVPPAAIEVEAQVGTVSKSEKKKKKEKHKHKDKDKDKEKDKDKSKDREERKKHKKDKDKHKEREREAEPVPHNEPAVKIKISKEKLEAAAKAVAAERSGEFKIKIPKERITAPSAPPPALKIKISKDRLENYTSGPSTSSSVTTHLSVVSGPPVANYYTATTYAAANNPTVVTIHSTSGSSSSSGRKRDRDKDKEKKRSSDGSRSSSSKSASKIHHMTNNMSQLFGEFNDDDDDDDVYQSYQEYTKSKQLQNASSSSSATASSSQSQMRQNFDYGSRNVQSQQQTQQHFSQQSAQHQLQQR